MEIEFNGYIITIIVAGALFFASVIWALQWALKNGQLERFDQGARVIFSEDEPEGAQTDFFPGHSHQKTPQKPLPLTREKP
jgi:nitrogen fixation-related uncharacterized protein